VLTLNDVELDVVAFLQALVSVALDGAVVDEDIRAFIATDEAISLGVVEPLDFAPVLSHVRTFLDEELL
jgi:hypothetical protein